jgi:hypothetical protein
MIAFVDVLGDEIAKNATMRRDGFAQGWCIFSDIV